MISELKHVQLLNKLVSTAEEERIEVVRAQKELREKAYDLLEMENELNKCKAEYDALVEAEQLRSLELDEWIVAKSEARGVKQKMAIDKEIKAARKAHETACEASEEARQIVVERELDVLAERREKDGYSREFYGRMMELNECVTRLNKVISAVNDYQVESLPTVNFIEFFDKSEVNGKLIIKKSRVLGKYAENEDGLVVVMPASADEASASSMQ